MKSLTKKVFLLMLLGVFGFKGVALAQEPVPESLTLKEAIEYALRHNVNVKNERLNLGIAKAQVGETMAQGFPQIEANGNFTYNIIVQSSLVDPARFSFGADSTANPEAPKVFQKLQFGLPYQSSASVSVNQMIFNGSYFVGLKAAKIFKELAEKDLQKVETDVAEGVALAYYGALVAQERAVLLKANFSRIDTLLRETKAMNEQGFAEKIDVQRLQVNLNNVKTEYQTVLRSLELNKNMLKFQVGIPVNQDLELSESIADFELENDPLLGAEFSYDNRIEYQQLQVTNKLAELDVKNNLVQYYPSLTAFANYGVNSATNDFSGLFEPVLISESGEVNNRYPWFESASVGLNLRVPIFDGFLKANRIKRARLEGEKVRNQIQNLENAIDLEVEQAQVNFQNALESLEAQKANIELAQEVYRVAKIKYQEGVGSNLEVVEAENALKSAETNYFQALYNALVERTSYRKATGTLYQK